jgi:hypothetical protein
MADQDFIRKQVEELTKKIQIAQDEIVDAIIELTSGKSNAEAVKIINELDVDQIVKLKTSGILAGYTSAQTDILLSKQFFGDISEEDIRALLIASEQYFGANLVSMGGVIKQQVLNGIINNKTADDILETIARQGYGTTGLNRIIRDGMNNYSRAVSAFMIEEAPENTKYIYIGPADEKTREFCLQASAAGALTIKQIRDKGWIESLTDGGGVNCRHNWEIASADVRSQFNRGEEAQEILDA